MRRLSLVLGSLVLAVPFIVAAETVSFPDGTKVIFSDAAYANIQAYYGSQMGAYGYWAVAEGNYPYGSKSGHATDPLATNQLSQTGLSWFNSNFTTASEYMAWEDQMGRAMRIGYADVYSSQYTETDSQGRITNIGGTSWPNEIIATYPASSGTAPTCSITFDKNPINPGDVTKIHWASTNASLFYINNVGYVSGTGSASLPPAIVTTDYSGSVTGEGSGTALSSYGVDILEKNGGGIGYPGKCFDGAYSHPINVAAQYITVTGHPGLPGSPGGNPVCEISDQSGSISRAQWFVNDKDGNIAYQSPTAVDCGTRYDTMTDAYGWTEGLFRWSDAPRHIDLDQSKAPYTISTQGSGCNGYSMDYLTTAAAIMVTEYAGGTASCPATLTVTGTNPNPGGQCTPSGGSGGTGGTAATGPQVSTFDTPGTYTFTVPNGVTSIDYLVVAGGGGGGGDGGGPQANWGSQGIPWLYPADATRGTGGGGAGGARHGTLSVTPNAQITVVVGVGGAGGSSGVHGGNGENSSFGSIVAHGGGAGGSTLGGIAEGSSGGSGGGGTGIGFNGCTGYFTSIPNAGGDGTATEGNPGGSGSVGMCGGGGGGGAGGSGIPAPGTDGAGGAGGAGYMSSISGTMMTYACGGGGGTGGSGGCASAGRGANGPHGNGGNAQAGTGSGGGGTAVSLNSGIATGGHGGSGIVVIAWNGLPANNGGGPNGGGSSSSTFTCGTDGNLHDSCGNTTTCQYGCSTVTNQCKTDTQCTSIRVCSADGMRVVKSCDGSLIDDCATHGAGYSCVAGACVKAPITFRSFSATRGGQAFTATGHLQVSPNLVRPGDRSNVYWNVLNAASCSVTSNIADAWSGLLSGATGKETSPILFQTTYTLHCTAFPGVTPSTIEESAIVNVLPTFQEQ